MKKKPFVGQIVHFYAQNYLDPKSFPEPTAAIITAVNVHNYEGDYETVNLCLFSYLGEVIKRAVSYSEYPKVGSYSLIEDEGKVEPYKPLEQPLF